MKNNIVLLLRRLDHKNQAATSWEREALVMIDDTLKAGEFIQNLRDEIEKADCLHCNAQPFCRFYLAFAYLNIEKVGDATRMAAEAIEGFYMRGLDWNQAMAHWLLGLIQLQEGNNNLSLRSLELALSILTPMIRDLKVESNYKKASDCEICIEQIHEDLNKVRLAPIIHVDRTTVPASAIKPIPATPVLTPEYATNSEGYLSIPWIPIYEDVQAGANGPIWIDPPKREKTELHQVVLQGTPCSIHPVHKGNNCVVINSERQYAWARIRGHSMEEATSTPIQENDYVLFYMTDVTEVDNIVVVAQNGSGADNSLMVKRIDLERQILLSQTNRKGEEYEPIPFNPERHHIVGVVVAVAKPTIQESLSLNYDPSPKTKSGMESGALNEASLPLMITKGIRQQLHNQGYSEDDINHMTPQQAWDNIDEGKLYQNLVTKVQGDHEVAKRLIEYEQSQKPQSSRKELINLAILKWEKDNR